MFFSSSNLVKLDLDLDLDPGPHSKKLLDPDPRKMNADPQPCCKRREKKGKQFNQVSGSIYVIKKTVPLPKKR